MMSPIGKSAERLRVRVEAYCAASNTINYHSHLHTKNGIAQLPNSRSIFIDYAVSSVGGCCAWERFCFIVTMLLPRYSISSFHFSAYIILNMELSLFTLSMALWWSLSWWPRSPWAWQRTQWRTRPGRRQRSSSRPRSRTTMRHQIDQMQWH